MASATRSYEDACGAAHALDFVGERWALLVMRELMLGPRRFGELRAGLPGISANVLTQRLTGLERIGVLVRRKLPPPASVQVYELTPWGYESLPILETLGRWAVRSHLHDPTLPSSAASLFISFGTMFDAARAEGFAARIGFRFGEESYVVALADGALVSARGPIGDVDARIEGTPPAVASVVYGGRPLADLERAGVLTISGDRSQVERFLTLFPLPPKIDAEPS